MKRIISMLIMVISMVIILEGNSMSKSQTNNIEIGIKERQKDIGMEIRLEGQQESDNTAVNIIDETQKDGNSGISIEEQEESEGINSNINPFFPYQGEESLYADGEYYDENIDLVESAVKLKISFIKAYENGSVYKISIESLDYYQDDRTYIYLYVTTEQIYRIHAKIMGNEEVISFYNDDERLKEIFDTDEKIIVHADVVCQEEEINEDLEQGEEGRYYTVKKTGDQVVGSYLWIKSNGEIGYYEGFTWKENVGLINYYSGYGAQRDIINLNNIGYEIKPLG